MFVSDVMDKEKNPPTAEVAILVVVDVCFRQQSRKTVTEHTTCRNPCCSGCLFPTCIMPNSKKPGRRYSRRRIDGNQVAILVVVDVCFRQNGYKGQRLRRLVAILVVVDVCFRLIVNSYFYLKRYRRNPCCSGCLFPTQ